MISNHLIRNIAESKHPLLGILKLAVFFSVIALLILSLTRMSVLAFVVDWGSLTQSEFFAVLFTGLRFDLKIIGSLLLLFMCLPGLIFSLINQWMLFARWLRVSLFLLIVAILFLSFLDFGFYLYFRTPIDSVVFGIVEDGTTEVVSSIFSDSRLLLIIAFFIMAILLAGFIFIKRTKIDHFREKHSSSRIMNSVYVLLLTLFMVIPARGSFDTFPLSRKTVNISDNSLTNSLMFNAPYHLYYTFKDRSEDSFNNLTAEKVLQDSGLDSVRQMLDAAGYASAEELMQVTTKKSSQHRKPHIVFVLMESWSSHIAMMDSVDNNVLGAFSKHAKEDYFYPYFFSNAYATNSTIDSLLMNSPITPLSQSRAVGHAFKMSNLRPFKQQGYDTLFLSGSSSGWRNHNNFWPEQGFDRYLGRATIESHYGVESDNPWGVYESYLFDYLRKTLIEADATGKPSFSFVLTTNNHPPIRLPEDYQPPEFNLQLYGLDQEDAAKAEILSGFHYQSNALGQFLDWLKKSDMKDDVIVVATGDHIYKGFVNATSPRMAFLRYSVPAYFYLPDEYALLDNSNNTLVGSHEDLFPTLFEIALPETEYFAFGTPLMQKQPQTAYGWINQDSLLFEDGVASNGGFYSWQDESRMLLSEQRRELAPDRKKIIEQLGYRTLLKKYLLVRELEQSMLASRNQ
ncbi:MAG: sulfatase-like hydrolase/transferase [Gammaproteobacteria bacterium]|nr:sulfatase-like hydrolase/transferase [Gammaproteobacteria bacterium]